MGATGAIAPVILRKRLIAPAVSTRNGKIISTLSIRNIKILNTPVSELYQFSKHKIFFLSFFSGSILTRLDRNSYGWGGKNRQHSGWPKSEPAESNS